MQSKGNAPSAAQKQWRERVRSLGCVVTGSAHPEIHHVLGATAKINKVAVGHWYILPLHHQLHRTGIANVGNAKAYFEERYGTQRALFKRVCQQYKSRYGELPFGAEVLGLLV